MEQFKNDIDRIYGLLKDVSNQVHAQNEQVIMLRIDIATLKTELKFKSGLWGFAAGAVPALILIALEYLKKTF